MPELTPSMMEQIAAIIRPTASPYPDRPIYSDDMKFKLGVLSAVKKFRNNFPYRVGNEKRIVGMMRLIMELSTIYTMENPKLEFTELEKENSFGSHYNQTEHKITMVGKLSIITLLHEFAHALGKDEHGATKWSLSLFKKCFPKDFEKLVADRHCLVVNTPLRENLARVGVPEIVLSQVGFNQSQEVVNA